MSSSSDAPLSSDNGQPPAHRLQQYRRFEKNSYYRDSSSAIEPEFIERRSIAKIPKFA
ncbi:hypothetical protein JJD41_17225 [Oxynema sp. CENA135]|uniref:hypothetical protein n=1 Tax=Oxynema sp. CENA135 TaxID=984206 RepID=UPI00190D4FC5|nr:hypothetical protein [Oxynema sp. CENA135]MBK4731593.1 hypothetical protein [Oxynema sp. CENA135]